MKPFDALRADQELRRLECPRAPLRKCNPHAVPRQAELLSPEQLANVEAKERFAARVVEVLKPDEQSVRELALYFGVKRTTLHERMRLARTDLAPLPEWFEKLDRQQEFDRLAAEFLRTA